MIACLLLMGLVAYSRIGAGRVLNVRASYPTQAKPQSKLWYAQNHWWAWLPDGSSSSIWRRDHNSWVRTQTLDGPSPKLPGYADVWADEECVCAVLMSETRITVAKLRYDADAQIYVYASSHTWPTQQAPVQSATITRDAQGHWWIAYDQQRCIWVRRSTNTEILQWGEPFALADKLDDDDLSVIVNTPEGVGVVWTDQIADRVCFRGLAVGDTSSNWSELEVIDQGENTANNHLNAAIGSDGAVYVVTKTSRYVAGQPVLSLHKRNLNGAWEKNAYGDWSESITPTRPIALLSPEGDELRLVHTLLDNSLLNRHSIACRGAKTRGEPSDIEHTIISSRLDLRSPTSCKQHLPADAPWIVLGSDRFGNVYEGELPR